MHTAAQSLEVRHGRTAGRPRAVECTNQIRVQRCLASGKNRVGRHRRAADDGEELLSGGHLIAHCVLFLLWMGILNDLFSERRYIASAPSLSNTAELSKSCRLVGVLDGRVGGGAQIAGARGAGDRAGRSN